MKKESSLNLLRLSSTHVLSTFNQQGNPGGLEPKIHKNYYFAGTINLYKRPLKIKKSCL